MPPIEEKKTDSQSLQPVAVTVIGTGSVTGGPAPMQNGTVATTPAEHQPNLVVTVISPIVALAIRFGYAYMTTLVGLVGAGLTNGDAIPHNDFFDLVWRCAGLSLAGPLVSLGKDIITVFSRLEQKFPLATGNV